MRELEHVPAMPLCLQIIAIEVVNSKKAIGRLHTQKAHMMEMEMALKHQLGAQIHISAMFTPDTHHRC